MSDFWMLLVALLGAFIAFYSLRLEMHELVQARRMPVRAAVACARRRLRGTRVVELILGLGILGISVFALIQE